MEQDYSQKPAAISESQRLSARTRREFLIGAVPTVAALGLAGCVSFSGPSSGKAVRRNKQRRNLKTVHCYHSA